MIRKVLVPLDGVEDPTTALQVAASIAGLSRAALSCLVIQDQTRFVHLSLPLAIAETLTGEAVIATPLSAEELVQQEEKFEEELRTIKEAFANIVSAVDPGAKFETVRGMPGEIIKNAARGADLLILPACSSKANNHSSELHALLRGITRPILVVPDKAQGSSRIVIAYDASPGADRAVRAAVELATIMQLEEAHVVSVTSEPEVFQPIHRQLEEYLKAYNLTVKTTILKGRTEEAIFNYVREADPTVLAMGAFGSNAISETIFGSTTAAVLKEADTAVLLVG